MLLLIFLDGKHKLTPFVYVLEELVTGYSFVVLNKLFAVLTVSESP